MPGPQVRFSALRATLFAVVCVGMALTGHAAAGAPAPGPGVFFGAVVGIALLALPFAGRRRSAGSLVAGLLAAQVLLHLLFSVAPHAAGARPAPGPMCGAGLIQAGDVVMALGHLWAALVTGWWLASGEDALWAVLRWLRARLLPPLAGTGHGPARPPRCHGGAPMALVRLRALRNTVGERAPPLALAA